MQKTEITRWKEQENRGDEGHGGHEGETQKERKNKIQTALCSR
jgi:hypothetical protein